MTEPTSANETTRTFTVTGRLLRCFLPGELRPVIVGLLLVVAASGVAVLQPWPLKLVIDTVVGSDAPPAWLATASRATGLDPSALHANVRFLLYVCLALLVIEVLLGVINVLSAYLLHSVALRMVFKLRCALFEHVQRLSLAFHEQQPVGDSLYRIAWDSYCIQAIFSEGIVPALTAGTTLVGIALVMFSRDWRLTAAGLTVAIPLIILVRRLDKPMTEQSLRVHEYESEVSTRVQETLVGIRAVQAYGREEFETERFEQQADASLRANLRLTLVQTASQAVVGLLLASGTAAVIWLGARGVLDGRISAGDLVLLVAYVAMIFKPLETLAYTAGAVQSAAAGARRVLALLDSAPEVVEAPDAVALLGRAKGELRFEHVTFGYRPRIPVLRDVDLTITAGSSVALVGASGTGKTTLASLALRFYDPAEGRLLLDGQDLRRLKLKSLREQIALVTQEPILFAASIRENIAYGRPGATGDQIEAAARAAGAHEFVQALPEGYGTRIAERGTNLSGGQRQRLAIARAFLKDAPILVLDEPTSALDAQTEQALLQALERLMQGRTTLIIAHRLSTVRCAGKIVVLKAGRVVESGTEQELLEHGGEYARMHQLQSGEAAREEAQPALT